MGPRHRPKPKAGEDSEESSSSRTETSQPLVRSPKNNISTSKALELPVSSEGMVWDSEVDVSCSEKSGLNDEVDIDHHYDLDGQNANEEDISEVELWRQLEDELYDPVEGDEANITKEIREEEAEAIAEISEIEPESSVPDTKEVHRFFPPGKIMHIVSLHLDEPGDDTESRISADTDSRISADTDNSQLTDTKIGIFLTSRSLYSKLRLSRTMIADHFMPVYRKQIERLIEELEKENTLVNINTGNEAEIKV